MAILALLSGLIYIFSQLLIIKSIKRHSPFWIYYIAYEYFFIIGLGIYPIFLAFSKADINDIYIKYNNLESFNPITFFHLMTYSFGALLGYFGFKKLKYKFSHNLTKFIDINPSKSIYLCFFLLLSSLIVSGIYILLVGFEKAFYGGYLARSGNFDELSGYEQYRFLVRFLYFSIYAVSFLPFLIEYKKWGRTLLFLILVNGLLGYFLTGGRYFLFQCIFLPTFYYIFYGTNNYLLKFLLSAVAFSATILILIYGKELPAVINNFLFFNSRFEFTYTDESTSIFKSFSHLIFSIDTGINYFFSNGLVFFKDVYLSLLGIFPSQFFSLLGLENLSYQFTDKSESLSCNNTLIAIGSYDTCFLPPYFTGASAYTAPIAGGLIFAIFRYFLYSSISLTWKIQHSNKNTPYLIFISMMADQIMLFIPATISFTIFISILFFTFVIASKK